MLKVVNAIKDPPPELHYILWRWLPTLDIWKTLEGRMYIKSMGVWAGHKKGIKDLSQSVSISIHIDKKHVKVPKEDLNFTRHDPHFEFLISGNFAEIPPWYLSMKPRYQSHDDVMTKVDFTNPNALDYFYKLLKRAIGKLLNPRKGEY